MTIAWTRRMLPGAVARRGEPAREAAVSCVSDRVESDAASEGFAPARCGAGGFRRQVLVAGAAVAVLFVWLITGVGGPDVTMAVDDLAVMAAPLLAAVACRSRSRRERGQDRRGWVLLGGSALSWGLGQAVWSYYELIAGREVPFPSAADVGYLGAAPLAVAAMLSFFAAPAGWTSRLRAVTDGFIVAAATLFVSWFVVLGALVQAGEGSILAQAISLAYPVADVVIVSIVVIVVARNATDLGLPLGWIAVGLLAMAAADTGFAYFTLQGNYETGNLVDVGWFAGYLCVALAAVRPARGGGRGSVAGELTWLPYVPVVGVVLLSAARVVAGGALGGYLLAYSCLVTGLVVIRQVLTLSENRNLTDGLEATVLARTLELTHSEGRLLALVSNVSDVITILDGDGTIRYVSPSVREVFGYEAAAVIATSGYDFVHPDDQPLMVDVLAGHTPGYRRIELRSRHADGSWRRVEATGVDMRGDPALGGFVFTIRDVTAQRELEDQLAHQAFHDPLTGLANRALLADRLGHALARIQRTGRDLAVAFVDLDDFKTINDTLGHGAGDRLLVAVASRLVNAVRPGDTVARMGGDEFSVLMEEADEASAMAIADRVSAVLAAPFELDGTEVFVTASIGVATSGPATNSPEEVLRDADVAMYRAKAAGKARHEVFRPEMHQEVVDRVALVADLRHALDRAEFELHYQPITELATGRFYGVEALLRWAHPVRGAVSPGEFIPAAEQSGLIVPIGDWVLRTAIAQLAAWDRALPGGAPLTGSVNISVRQLQEGDLAERVQDALAEFDLEPSRLTLELTESMLLDDAEEMIERLASLKRLGVRIAIDDFGTGFSSMSYLRRLPVDALKIDKAFIDDLATTRGAGLVQSLVQLGTVLGLDTIAEGIEHPAQLAALHDCRFGQGYLFSRPLTALAIVDLLLRERSEEGATVG